jgi:pyruvate dehydrogenase E2 component (dihydrolipoamide acetyltransferase)
MARESKQASLDPAHFTVSSLGMFNTEGFSAIINPPESAVLAVGKTERRPVVRPDDSLALRDGVNMTLSVDHRVADGA